MSMPDLWKPWQPRVSFPLFSGVENTYEFTVQPTLKISSWRNFVYPAYAAYKNLKTWHHAFHDYLNILVSNRITFDVHRLDQEGRYIEGLGRYGPYGIGDSFIYKTRIGDRQSEQDGLILFVASRGRVDPMGSSPGNMTARYVGPHCVSGYRTGFFSRSLNDSKGHYGFLGLNPALTRNPEIRAGLLLINHSSDLAYGKAVEPRVRLYKSHDDFLEADFGPIAPHGFREVALVELFPELESWGKDACNIWAVTECKGVTLASFHTYRNRRTELMAIEHSRPSHTQVIKYWKRNDRT